MKAKKSIVGSILLFYSVLYCSYPHAASSYQFESYLAPSRMHWLGTNSVGQDVVALLIEGTKWSLIVGFVVATASTFLSVVLGVWAGYFRKWDPLWNGLANILLVLPNLLIILLVVAFTGGQYTMLLVLMSVLSWPAYMRIIRAQVMSLKEREFIQISRQLGNSPLYILTRHFPAHLKSLVQTKWIMTFRYAILTEAGLAFLGLGDPVKVTWGKLLHDGFSNPTIFLNGSWVWLIFPPVLLLAIVTVYISFIIEGTNVKRKSLNRKKRVQCTEESGLRGEQVTLHYGTSTPIFEDVSLDVQRGEIVSITGPSGSGKTSLARAMYGILPVAYYEGHGQMDGQWTSDPQFSSEHYFKAIAFMYQDARAAFNPLLPIRQQFEELGVTQDEMNEALKEVQLHTSIANRYPHECSGGMLSRVLVALTFVRRPRYVICDEVTSALDPILKKEIIILLQQKAKQLNCGVLMITHDHDVAHAISDRTLQMTKENRDD